MPKHVKWHQTKFDGGSGERCPQFRIGNGAFFPGFREGLAEWTAKIEDCVQDFSEKHIARNAALRNGVAMG